MDSKVLNNLKWTKANEVDRIKFPRWLANIGFSKICFVSSKLVSESDGFDLGQSAKST